MRKYCEACGKEVETKIIAKRERYDVCGEEIETDAQVLVCAECGEEFYCEELDEATLLRAYNIYRRRHKLLLPEEIRQIREQYGLSQRSFSKLLNWGDKTIRRYENGSIQDKAHNSLLLFLREPENMLVYLTENETPLEGRQRQRLMETVEKLRQDGDYRAGRKLAGLFFAHPPSVENGFKLFDYEKLCAMVLFFAHRSAGLLKTKLLKLLNYADMIFYQEHGVSMSGLCYVHLPYGPVPQDFDLLFGMLASDHVAHIEVVFEDGYERHQVIPERGLPEDVLSPEEREVLERICERFAGFGSVEISNYSHQEKGYRATRQGEIIPYSYAKEIRLY